MTDITTDRDRTQADLWTAHADRMLRYATFLVGPSDANDVVADAFASATPRLLTKTVSDVESYLIRSVRNRAHTLRRSRLRRWRRDLSAIGPTTTGQPDTYLDVRRAVSKLSLAQRTVVYLTYWEDRTVRDIAEILDIAPSTVQRHLQRARQHLEKEL